MKKFHYTRFHIRCSCALVLIYLELSVNGSNTQSTYAFSKHRQGRKLTNIDLLKRVENIPSSIQCVSLCLRYGKKESDQTKKCIAVNYSSEKGICELLPEKICDNKNYIFEDDPMSSYFELEQDTSQIKYWNSKSCQMEGRCSENCERKTSSTSIMSTSSQMTDIPEQSTTAITENAPTRKTTISISATSTIPEPITENTSSTTTESTSTSKIIQSTTSSTEISTETSSATSETVESTTLSTITSSPSFQSTMMSSSPTTANTPPTTENEQNTTTASVTEVSSTTTELTTTPPSSTVDSTVLTTTISSTTLPSASTTTIASSTTIADGSNIKCCKEKDFFYISAPINKCFILKHYGNDTEQICHDALAQNSLKLSNLNDLKNLIQGLIDVFNRPNSPDPSTIEIVIPIIEYMRTLTDWRLLKDISVSVAPWVSSTVPGYIDHAFPPLGYECCRMVGSQGFGLTPTKCDDLTGYSILCECSS